VHVNQFTAIDGIAACVKHNALSVDHLEIVTEEDINALKGSETMPVALPSCSYFISIPYTPARRLLDAGLPLALASDFNPGTTPSGNMNFVVATACIKMKMTPEEAINAATLNGAYALGLSDTHGSITVGKVANLIITKPLNSFYEIPYAFGSNLIEQILVKGNLLP
jgi:imidazolonepropionase